MAGLDEVDRAILAILKRDARASYAQIARALGISESAVRKRVSSLIERGFIERFTVEEGNGIRAFILINLRVGADTSELVRRLLEVEHVERVYEVSGQYDLIAVAFARSTEEINEALERIRGIEGVERTYTCIALRGHYPTRGGERPPRP